jgi:protein CpxP
MDIFARKHLTVWLIGALAIMNLVTLATLWYAVIRKPQPAPPPREGNPSESVNRFLEQELHLAPEQTAEFREMRRSHTAEQQAIQDEIRRLKKAEMDELLTAQPDQAKGEALAAAIGAKETEKEKLLFAHLRNLMALCRPEQQERFRSIMGELIRMMGPPGQPQPEKKPPEKKPNDRPDEKPPERMRPGRSGDNPPGEKPPGRNDERPPQKRR